ncbi:MAG: hypothetical protein HY880_03375 [Deltaproteobacteria bacterium]|nr:hypothetical protein [Deltaproteobacteria bacterium]
MAKIRWTPEAEKTFQKDHLPLAGGFDSRPGIFDPRTKKCHADMAARMITTVKTRGRLTVISVFDSESSGNIRHILF